MFDDVTVHACLNVAGSSKHRAPSAIQIPMMFASFGCDSNRHNTLSDCYTPSGVTTSLFSTSCTPSNALGILCAREFIVAINVWLTK